MIKLLVRFAILAALAFAFTWMADQPGTMSVTWLGYQIEEIPVYLMIGLFVLLFFVLWFAWWLIRLIFGFPSSVGDVFRARRHRKGIEALSKGMVAVSAGDAQSAQRQALQAKKLVADSPLAHLLEAQAAQLRGDNSRVSQIYQEMLKDPETEVVALRGLYVAARKDGDDAAAQKYAAKAHHLDTSLAWASQALSGYLSNDEDWPAVARLIDSQRRSGIIDRDMSNARKAVVYTAQAMAAEDDPDAMIDLAMKAHKLDPSLVPAAVVAGRAHAEHGSLRKASRVLEKTWRLSPHPDIADAYIHARSGDSAQDRLQRVKELLRVSDGGVEGAIAQARAAIDARDWTAARKALDVHTADRPSSRLCLMMAEIEDGEFGDHGRSREWLSRAVRAPRDPAWTADGYVSETWLPVSPVSGELGAFEWRVPLTALGTPPEDSFIPEPEKEAPLPGDDAVVVGGSGVAAAAEAVAEEAPEPDEDVADEPAVEEPAPEDPVDEVAAAGGEADEAVAAEEDQKAVEEAEAQAEDAEEDPDREADTASSQEPDETAADRSGSAVPPAEPVKAAAEEEADAPDMEDVVRKQAADTVEAGEEVIEQLLPDNRQPDDPGPRTDRPVNGKRSWFS